MKRSFNEGRMTVISDNKWKNFLYKDQVPHKVLRDQFAYLNDENGGYDGFFQYQGSYYHVSEFSSFTHNSADEAATYWQSYAADSYFSGVLLSVSSDGEQYKVGRYFQ